MQKNPKFAVILSGCGRADGSEIHEATCALLAIDCQNCPYQCFAPDMEQAAVVNHLTGKITGEKRNVLIEAARIARGNIKSLEEFCPDDFDAVVFPGGIGAVINWCDFAESGVSCSVETSVRKAIWDSYKKGLVIGAMCIAPVVIAKVLGGEGVHVTVGNDRGVADSISRTGAVHEERDSVGVCVDELHKVVTTPAYMLASSIKEVCEGADNMVKAMLKLL